MLKDKETEINRLNAENVDLRDKYDALRLQRVGDEQRELSKRLDDLENGKNPDVMNDGRDASSATEDQEENINPEVEESMAEEQNNQDNTGEEQYSEGSEEKNNDHQENFSGFKESFNAFAWTWLWTSGLSNGLNAVRPDLFRANRQALADGILDDGADASNDAVNVADAQPSDSTWRLGGIPLPFNGRCTEIANGILDDGTDASNDAVNVADAQPSDSTWSLRDISSSFSRRRTEIANGIFDGDAEEAMDAVIDEQPESEHTPSWINLDGIRTFVASELETFRTVFDDDENDEPVNQSENAPVNEAQHTKADVKKDSTKRFTPKRTTVLNEDTFNLDLDGILNDEDELDAQKFAGGNKMRGNVSGVASSMFGEEETKEETRAEETKESEVFKNVMPKVPTQKAEEKRNKKKVNKRELTPTKLEEEILARTIQHTSIFSSPVFWGVAVAVVASAALTTALVMTGGLPLVPAALLYGLAGGTAAGLLTTAGLSWFGVGAPPSDVPDHMLAPV